MSTLPHRFAEKSFRRYESTIAKVVNTFPWAVKVSPQAFGLSAETVRGRLRDALTSYFNHRWHTTMFNPDSFDKVHENLIVSLQADGTVIVGTKEAIKAPQAEEVFIPSVDVLDLSTFYSSSCEEVLSFLAHSGALKKQIKLVLNQTTADVLLSKYDIVLTPVTNENTYLLQ